MKTARTKLIAETASTAMTALTMLLLLTLLAAPVAAKIDLVTLPTRDTVQLTIYNSADLTLARESRTLTLKKGLNKLQFSWANTLIDPTSLDMLCRGNADSIDIHDLTYPARSRNLGLWNIASETAGKVPVEITYLTSGLSWRAFYMGTLAADEKTMTLAGYVRVTNNSGEDYENAQVRLIVGKVHQIDQIAELANREFPYGRPTPPITLGRGLEAAGARQVKKMMSMDATDSMPMSEAAPPRPKEIVKEGLSEYFLYTIEGTETIPTGWSKRLPSFTADDVPVINLYKNDERRYGESVVRFLSFKNDSDHQLGETPIPGGMLKVFRSVDKQQHLSYEGQSSFQYIPVDEDVELNLGAVENVIVEPKLMDHRTDNYRFDNDGNISGHDEINTFKIELKNTRDIPVKIEIKRHFDTNYWSLAKTGEFGQYKKIDKDTVQFTLELSPRTTTSFQYTLTTYHGKRQEESTK